MARASAATGGVSPEKVRLSWVDVCCFLASGVEIGHRHGTAHTIAPARMIARWLPLYLLIMALFLSFGWFECAVRYE